MGTRSCGALASAVTVETLQNRSGDADAIRRRRRQRAVTRSVLVNAGPWLPVPPPGYGGIENVVATLVPELRARGVRVVLATVGAAELECDGRIGVFDEGQFRHIAGPYNAMSGIAHAHLQAVVAALDDLDVDIVHDHVEVVGPAVLSALGPSAPPVLHTLHWDLRKHPDFYSRFDGRRRVWCNGVSERQIELAPPALRDHILGAVPLATRVDEFPFEPVKGEHLVQLARVTALKGTGVAARVCRRVGLPLIIAGPVAGIGDPAQLDAELADPESPIHHDADARFYRDEVRPLEDGALVRWVGAVEGAERVRLLATARAAIFPVQWEEPGGTAVVEALACGTPAIGLRRGCLPTLIDDGVTGFLADDEDGLAACLRRVGEIDPAACRRAAEERFSPAAMAERYLGLYDEVLSRARPGRGR
jgi:glycosyltransferase involved in cell wall biosynthesis